jgi:hypothetical protein
MSKNSYHDVVVWCGETKWVISEQYALHLTCNRTSGWELWWLWEGKEKLLGSEFGDEPFCVAVHGVAIVGVVPE